MKSSIVPTVGRIVLCHLEARGKREVLPGIILRVFPRNIDAGEYDINVRVFGDQFNVGWDDRTLYAVRIVDAGTNGVAPPESTEVWCEWMPYQMGQAAKAQEAESKLADTETVQTPA